MLNVAIQMDPLHSINPKSDSTFLIALEMQSRGHRLYHYLPSSLSLRHNRLFCHGQGFQIDLDRKDTPFEIDPQETFDLSSMDVVLMRQDPPFNLSYITATHLLEHLPTHIPVINDPVSVRNAPEKFLITHFPDLTPPTLVTQDLEQAKEFRRQYQDIVLKPLYGAGGSGVFHVGAADENFSTIFEVLTSQPPNFIVIQRYLPEIKQGDKRIILFDGHAVGAVLREPLVGEARANFHSGGTPKATTLTAHETELCQKIGPLLRERALLFVGIDVIGEYVTEINVTSPTGLQEINRLMGCALQDPLVTLIEEHVRKAKGLPRNVSP